MSRSAKDSNCFSGKATLLKRMLVAGFCVFQSVSAVSIAAEPASDLLALRKQARSLEQGEGVTRNVTEAIKLYCQVAKAGDADAMYRLGWIYAFGKGVQRDDTAAAYFFAKAADQGHPQSKSMLSLTGTKTAGVSPCMRLEEAEDIAYTDTQRQWADLVKRLAPEYGVAPRLALTLARTESNLNPRAISIKNAQGLMQLIPETAERFNVKKPLDPEQNVRGGLAYLRWLLAYFQGDVRLVAAAYNAGEGTVNKYLGVPPYPETRAYVANILSGYKQQTHPFDASVTNPSPDLPRIARRNSRKES
jgi:soluble lytic murein transglycosylase-like protein